MSAADTDGRVHGPIATLARPAVTNSSQRWLRFNLVGAMGLAVQMSVLWLLTSWAGVSAGLAVLVAVLAAVSHNFVWHERVTWPGLPRRTRFMRWLSFHASTGLVSLGGNLVVTVIVMRAMRWPPVLANLVAVLALSLANYWLSDRLVFRR